MTDPHLIIRCYNEIRTIRVVRTTENYYYTDYGKQRFRKDDSEIMAVCDDAAAAKALRARIHPIEAQYRATCRAASDESNMKQNAARDVRDAALREIYREQP